MAGSMTRRPDTGLPAHLGNRVGRMFDEMLRGLPFEDASGVVTSAWIPACDVFESQNEIKVVLELAGVRPDDVQITVEHNTLNVSGEKRQEAEEKTQRVHRYERTYGRFERSFLLPATVDVDQIDAQYADGLLTVVMPKVEKARPRQIPVKTG
jgi:HSP20 family protein